MKLAWFVCWLMASCAVASGYGGQIVARHARRSQMHPLVLGNIRISVLSYSLVRLEQKGPEGFEDRPTFNVVGRDGWPGSIVQGEPSGDTIVLKTPYWSIQIKNGGQTLGDVTIVDNSPEAKVLYAFDGKLENSLWLPSPGSSPRAWSFADTPRIVPPKGGITPGEDSGWDLTNDAPDVFVFLPNGDYGQLRSDFLKLTGPIEMPPLYALGFTDSRWYAYTEQEALDRIDQYRQRQIPLDTFVVDTDWRIGGSAGYTPDPKYFPDMPGFLSKAHEKHAHLMFNDHPEPRSKNALDPDELNFRYEGLAGLLNEGLDVWWYDRNWGVSLADPANNLRHEVWGMKLYHDMTLKARPNSRPLIMANVDGIDNGIRNRPPEVATHRYPVQWTGDTGSRWEFLRRGVENAVFEGAMGANAFVNEDLGGHIGTPTPDLYIRYLQFGSVCPFMRVHCTKGRTREPWAYGPDATRIVPEYIRMRYRLMPFLYANARASNVHGDPMVKRLDLQYPTYPAAAADDEFLLGDSVLVAPIVGDREAAPVPSSAFPDGLMGEYFANQELQGQPTVVRRERDLEFDWGNGSPDPRIPHDYFSARWTGRVCAPKDSPRQISITSDDGCRVWIDGKLLVDKWEPQDSVTTESNLTLAAGSTHELKVEYMQLTGGALCKLHWGAPVKEGTMAQRSAWIPPGAWTDVWTGERVTGPVTRAVHASLAQMPMFLRDGAILPIGPDVQWTGQKDWSSLSLEIAPGNGEFTLYEDDGSSLEYLNGQFRETPITVSRAGRTTVVSIGAARGGFTRGPMARAWNLRVLDPGAVSVTVDGHPTSFIKVRRTDAAPFRNVGGEPSGMLLEIKIPAGGVAKAHKVVIND